MTDLGAETLHVSGSSRVAWPIFLGNLGLGSGWLQLGSRGPPEGPDVDDDIGNTLGHIIAQHNGCLLRALFCEEMAGVPSDEMLLGIVIPWDSLIHWWKIGNGRLESMMEVITLVQEKRSGIMHIGGPNIHLLHIVYGSKAI